MQQVPAKGVVDSPIIHSKALFASSLSSILQATVHILPEISLLSHPEGSLWSCYHKFGCQATTDGALEKPYQVSMGKNRLGKTKYQKVIEIYTC